LFFKISSNNICSIAFRGNGRKTKESLAKGKEEKCGKRTLIFKLERIKK